MNWWVSCNKFTCYVGTDKSLKIIKAAPIVRKFTGQPLGNLIKWCQKLGGFKIEVLE